MVHGIQGLQVQVVYFQGFQGPADTLIIFVKSNSINSLIYEDFKM